MPLDKETEKALVNKIFEMEDEYWIVDNSRLITKSKGIKYRASPNIDDLDERAPVAKFGQVVEGISWPEGWLLTDGFGKRRFLPKTLHGVPILVPRRGREPTKYVFDDVDWPQPEPPPRPASVSRRNRSTSKDNRARSGTPVTRSSAPAARELSRPRAPGPPQLTKEATELLEVSGRQIRSVEELISSLNHLRALLEKATTSTINVRGADGFTPLMCAARRGNLDFCVELVSAGADGTMQTSEGLVAADYATWKPCQILVLALIGEIDVMERAELDKALEKLQPDVSDRAQELIRKAAAELLFSDMAKGKIAEEEPEEREQSRPRSGIPYKVVRDDVPIYDAPSPNAEELTSVMRGDTLGVFGYDRTRNWARVKIELPHGMESGWIQIQSEVLGELIKPMR